MMYSGENPSVLRSRSSASSIMPSTPGMVASEASTRVTTTRNRVGRLNITRFVTAMRLRLHDPNFNRTTFTEGLISLGYLRLAFAFRSPRDGTKGREHQESPGVAPSQGPHPQHRHRGTHRSRENDVVGFANRGRGDDFRGARGPAALYGLRRTGASARHHDQRRDRVDGP